jgi:4-amino-4-deoxy-L-arabinose transferase-like glycosyltransferase
VRTDEARAALLPGAALAPGRRALALVVLAVIVGFLAAMLAATSGRFVPQVVDLYLVCQYAKGFAEGHPFQYNPGEAPSTGATSLLHTTWLGLLHALGARGEALVAAAILTGALLYAASVAIAVRIGRRLAGDRAGLLAGGLVALGGPVVWGFLYGSDSALFLFLALLLFDRWLHAFETGRFSGSAVAGSLLALARPEGLPLSALLAGAALFGPSPASRKERLKALVPPGVGLVLLFAQKALTGSWLGTSVEDKSLLANYGLADTVGLVSGYVVDVARGLLLGFYPSEAPIGFSRGFAPFVFPPLALVLVLVALAGEAPPRRFATRSFVAAAAATGLLAGANTFMGVHFNRYLLWTFPPLLVLTAVGLSRLTRILAPADPRLEASLQRAGALLFLALGALSTARFAALYGAAAGEIARRELPMAEWIRTHLPPGVAIANAATSVEYLTGHRSLNLHGVTSPAFFGNRTAEREAGTFEALSRLETAQRPPYLLTSAAVQAGSALMRELTEGPPLFSTLSLADDLLLFHLRSDLPGRQAAPHLPATFQAVAGRREVDRLNVCDARDEAAHGYAHESRLGDLRLHGTVKIADYAEGPLPLRVADAGRAILGGERFRVRTQAGRGLVIVMRTTAAVEAAVLRASGSGVRPLEIAEGRLEILVGGKPAGRLALRPGPGWSEVVFSLPAAAVEDGRSEIELKGRYASYFYWFYQ